MGRDGERKKRMRRIFCLFDLPSGVAQAQTASAATNSRIFMTKREGTCKASIGLVCTQDPLCVYFVCAPVVRYAHAH